jgi:hypothetical protein
MLGVHLYPRDLDSCSLEYPVQNHGIAGHFLLGQFGRVENHSGIRLQTCTRPPREQARIDNQHAIDNLE